MLNIRMKTKQKNSLDNIAKSNLDGFTYNDTSVLLTGSVHWNAGSKWETKSV